MISDAFSDLKIDSLPELSLTAGRFGVCGGSADRHPQHVLNVLGAGVMAAEHGWDEATAVQMLEDEDVRSFAFAGDAFSWREWKVSANRIELHRQRVTSFGSCSFVEPREDLRALGLL